MYYGLNKKTQISAELYFSQLAFFDAPTYIEQGLFYIRRKMGVNIGFCTGGSSSSSSSSSSGSIVVFELQGCWM